MTSAVKLNRRPPLTTLATRLIATTRSTSADFSGAAPRSPRHCRRTHPGHDAGDLASELQPCFSCRVRQCGDAAVVTIAAAVEDDRRDALLLRALRDEGADLLGPGGLVALGRTDAVVQRRRGG